MASSIASPINLGDGDSLEEHGFTKQSIIDKTGGIFCHICNSIFGNKKDFDGHYAWHNTGGTDILYTCVVCKLQLNNYLRFNKHCYLHHVMKNKIQCKHCSIKFMKQSVLDSHVSAVHNYKCLSCNETFTHIKKLERHNNVIHPKENSFEVHDTPLKQTAIDKIGGILCHICESIFKNKKDYDSHYAQHNTGDAEIVYTCVVCRKNVSSYPSFRGHCYSNHVAKNTFQCEYCLKTFCKQSILNSHITSVHDYNCLSCNDKFSTKRDLETHKTMVHASLKGKDEPPYDCLLCGIVIETVDVCEGHIDDHCEMLYPCPICKEVLPNKLAAIKHLTKHFEEQLPNNITAEPSFGEDSSIDILGGILCRHCDLLCRNRAELVTHFKDKHHDEPLVYTCNICSKHFEKYDLFGGHCYDHFAKGKFQCDQCNRAFCRLSRLVIHMEAFHTDCSPDKPYGCEQCGHGYMTKGRLQEHLRIVHDEEASRSRCIKPGCSAIFDKPRDLIQHLKNHNPMLDNWCKQCGLQLTTLSSAEKHLDVHRHTQYSCPICKRAYGEKYLMQKHVPSHFESVLHICKTCGKGYNLRCRLIQHLKTHTINRSHKCTYCSKTFCKPHQLEQHMNVHTGLKPYACTLCPKRFANYPNWSKHLNRIHSVDRVKIKQLHVELKAETTETQIIKTSPTKTESGIESAGSEISDINTFMDSDDSFDDISERGRDWTVDNFGRNVYMREIDPVNGQSMSIADTVCAAISTLDSLDENLDWMTSKNENTTSTLQYPRHSEVTKENISQQNMDDMNDIQAIVEDIEAMSAGMETMNHVETTDSFSELEDANPEMLQYADMMPLDNAVINPISGDMETTLPEASYQSGCLPEYGPDFTSDSLTSVDDHILPHIDPLLTIKADNNAKMYVPNLNNFNFDSVTAPIDYGAQDGWAPPIITKVYKYEDNKDVNNMYIIY